MKTLFNIILILFGATLLSCSNNENKDQASNEESLNKDASVEVGQDVDVQDEADFLITAHMNSQLQITLGELADRQASSPEVKALSSDIIAENQQVQSNIKDLANAAEIELAPALTPEYLSLIDSIQSYEGNKFDSAFVNIIVEEHENDIERLNNLATKTSNPIIRREVTENVEILQRQLQQAKQIQEKIE